MALAIDFTNAAAYPTLRYSCSELCTQYPHIAAAYGHDLPQAIGMPPDAYHDLGPWTQYFSLRRCPTQELGDRMLLAPYFEHWSTITKGIPWDTRGSDHWPEVFWESYAVISNETAKGESWLRELKAAEARASRNTSVLRS